MSIGVVGNKNKSHTVENRYDHFGLKSDFTTHMDIFCEVEMWGEKKAQDNEEQQQHKSYIGLKPSKC